MDTSSPSSHVELRRALAYRRKYFIVAGVFALTVVVLILAAASSFQPGVRPDLVTWALLAFTVLEALFFAYFSFDPARIAANVGRARFAERPSPEELAKQRNVPFRFRARRLVGTDAPESLEQVGRLLAILGAGFALQPVLLGAVLVTISGDSWRVLVFVAVTLAAGAVYWLRIGRALARLEAEGSV